MKLALVMAILSLHFIASVQASDLAIAQKSLEYNIVNTEDGPYLRAGAHQFSGLWVRDFCYSIQGLLDMGRADVVKNQLITFIVNRRESDQLIPRLLDNISSKKRVLRGLFPWLGKVPEVAPPFMAEFEGEHKTIAIDSNILILRGLVLYINQTQDRAFPFSLEEVFQELLNFYDSKMEKGFIVQDEYGDWQDSVKRKGVTFLTNFHYWWVLYHASQLNLITPDQTALYTFKKRLQTLFYDKETGLYKSHQDLKVISLDGNALALSDDSFWDTTDQRNMFYQAFKKSRFHQVPGLASYPDYPRQWRSLNVKVVGLSHYHDRLAWSWLIGLQGLLAIKMGDLEEANRISKIVSQILKRDELVGEVYKPSKNYKPFRRVLYKSETPFSWGSAFIYSFLFKLSKQ